MSIIKSTSYHIHIEKNGFEALNTFLSKKEYSKCIIICDENTIEQCLSRLLFNCDILTTAEIIELESGEKNKNLETCMQVWGALTDIGADKKSLIVNLGGGVISDLGCFVASTFKRGIDFINITTTLLAMAYASVGAKTGVDFEGIKNHIGTIYEPKGVFINIALLETLSERHIINGYAEIIKIALIADADFWQKIKKLKKLETFYSEDIITKAIELKNNIVKKDLYELTLRKSLNFGHSIGHAFESAILQQKKDILHGEAIAIGMLVESEIAHQLRFISKAELNSISSYLKTVFKNKSITNTTKKLILSFLKHDKKNEGASLCFALPNPIGKYKLQCGVTSEIIELCISKL
jgi:3-dehydroquinate synthase